MAKRSNRDQAQQYIQNFIDQGKSANIIQKELKELGLGYKRQDLLQDIRSIKNIELEGKDTTKYTPLKYRYLEPTESRTWQREKYALVYEITLKQKGETYKEFVTLEMNTLPKNEKQAKDLFFENYVKIEQNRRKKFYRLPKGSIKDVRLVDVIERKIIS